MSNIVRGRQDETGQAEVGKIFGKNEVFLASFGFSGQNDENLCE